jgi:3-oxocholest-4-en-26-oate---CoA ligase
MEMHMATVWEAVADAVPDATALVHGDTRRTWAEYDRRAAGLAGALTDAGLGPDSKVGLYLYNSNEYLESQHGAFKLRGVPVNVNYRYLDDELSYLLDNADAEALFFHTSLADRVDRVRERLPKLKVLVEVDDDGTHLDGAARYEDLVAHDPMPRIERREDDVYMLFTGGTTGMPKGVMYAQGGFTSNFVTLGYAATGFPIPTDAAQIPEIVRSLHESGQAPVSIPACPLMHGTGMWLGSMIPLLAGGTVVTLTSRSLDAGELWRAAVDERATMIVIVGDAFAKPMIRALDAAIESGQPYDLSNVRMIISSGVMWTAEVKEALLDRAEHLMLIDAMGSTEGGMGNQVTMRGLPVQTAKFTAQPETKLFSEDGRRIEPGSGEMGMVAAGGNVPLGYYKDPEKSANTFKVIDGVRYSFPGDWGYIEADGTLTLLGRGSQCINTGGEKVYPEEVEEAVKLHPAIEDCLVVGVPDEKFGERIVAVAALVQGGAANEGELIATAKGKLAAYKAPKQVVIVERVPRAPNGKADYKTAKKLAVDATT